MRLAELLPEFTQELCAALRASGDEHLAKQVESSSVHACSYDSEYEIGTLGIEPLALSPTAEVHVIGCAPMRRNVTVSSPHVVIDISNYGIVHGLEVFAASTIAPTLLAFRVP